MQSLPTILSRRSAEAVTTHNTFETQRIGRANMKTVYCYIFAVNAILMASAITVSDPGLDQAIDSVNRQAGIPWSRCNVVKGTCVDTRSFTCSTRTISNFCPGPDVIQCCPTTGGVVSRLCRASGGTCKRSDTCSGKTSSSDLCPGPDTITCCSIDDESLVAWI
jgi:hypothetical protein